MTTHQVAQVPINALTFTELKAPIAGNYYRISNSNGGALRKRSDPNDAATEVSVGTAEAVTAPWNQPGTRYKAGDTIWYAADPTGPSNAIVEVWA